MPSLRMCGPVSTRCSNNNRELNLEYNIIQLQTAESQPEAEGSDKEIIMAWRSQPSDEIKR